MFNPTILQHAHCLAKLQEATIKARKSRTHTPYQKPLLPNPPLQATPKRAVSATPTAISPSVQTPFTTQRPMPFRRTLTPAQFEEKKGQKHLLLM